VADYYKHVCARDESSIINKQQRGIKDLLDGIFSAHTAVCIQTILGAQPIEQYVTNVSARITWPHNPATGVAGCFEPQAPPAAVYTAAMCSALADHVIDSARAVRYLRSFPCMPDGASRSRETAPAPSPATYFGPGCALFERDDNGSSVMTAVVEVLGDPELEPVSTAVLSERSQTRISEIGESLVAQLADYYGRVVYHHENVVGDLISVCDIASKYTKDCEALLVRMDQMCGRAAGTIRARGIAKAVLALAKSGVPDSFRADIPDPVCPADTERIKSNIDALCAVVYASVLFGVGLRTLPQVDTGDMERDTSGRVQHEQCCLAVHRTVRQLVNTAVSACDTYAGPVHKASRARGAAANMTQSVSAALDRMSSVLKDAETAVCTEDAILGVIRSMPPVVFGPSQTTAYQALCGADAVPSSSLARVVEAVRHALCSGRTL
jgi:hypothetical protein